MDSKGRATDNIFIERLWCSFKYEEVYLNGYTSPREATQRIARYLNFYNYRRPHQSLDYHTPAELYMPSCHNMRKEVAATRGNCCRNGSRNDFITLTILPVINQPNICWALKF
jgi:putative transposase